MSTLKSILLSAAVVAGAGFATLTPAQAQDADFYIGPDGARVYIDRDDYRYRDRYYDRGYYYDHRYRPVYRHYRTRCYNRVDYDWRFGHRVRVVERVCYDRFGRRRVVDRDYYRIGW